MGLYPKNMLMMRALTALIVMAWFCTAANAQTGSVHYNLGVFSYEEGSYADAAAHLRKALDNRPDDAYAQVYLARTYLKQERFSEAEPLFLSAKASDPDIPGLSYDMGMLYYKTDAYDRAISAFDAVLAEDPTHVQALYHAGTSSVMRGRYAAAIDYLERASAASDSVKPGASYYMGISYYRLFEYEKALSNFDYAASAAATTILREDAERWAQITRMHIDREKPWRLYAKAGVQYDDNVQLAPLDSDRFAEESDYAAVLFVSGRYVSDAAAPTDIGIGYSHYQTFYRDFDEYNFTGSIGEVFAEHTAGRAVFGLFYIPAYYWVDNNSFLMQHQVRPEIRWRLEWAGEIGFSYSYVRNNYFTDARRDGHTHEYNIDYFHGLEGLDGYWFSGAGYTHNNAFHDDEAYTLTSLRTGLSVGFLEQYRLRVQGDFRDRRYDNRDSLFNEKRKDKRYGASAAAIWTPAAGRFDISLEYAYIRNDSNINDFDYRRNTLGMFVSAGF